MMLVIGAFFLSVGGVFAFYEIDQEVNATNNLNPHIDNTGKVMHGESPNSALREYQGDGNYKQSSIILGEINNKPIEWVLVWDYGDGTGIIGLNNISETSTSAIP